MRARSSKPPTCPLRPTWKKGLGIRPRTSRRPSGWRRNFLRGNPDLDDTIRRLQAFEKAGIRGKSFPVAELEAAGVKRISLATSLYRAAITGFLDAAKEAKEHGTFGYLDRTLSTPDLNGYMRND